MAIDIGPGSELLDSQDLFSTYSGIDFNNPANASGNLDTFKFRMSAGQPVYGLKMGTMYGSGTSYTSRDYVTLGDIVSGLGVFTGQACDVESGDFLAAYFPASGYNNMQNDVIGCAYLLGNCFTGSLLTGWTPYARRFSMEASGTETAVGGQPLKNVFGRPFRGCFR